MFLGSSGGLSTTEVRFIQDFHGHPTDFGRDVAINLDVNGDGLNGKAPGPRCPTCPLACVAGTAGTCGPIP